MLQLAIPVFVDTDRQTFQIDATKIEAAITPSAPERSCLCTWAVLPPDLDSILAVAKKHKLAVLEDACQAHLAEWRRRKVSTIGDAGLLQLPGIEEPQLGRGRSDPWEQRRIARASARSFHNNGRGTPGAGFSVRTATDANLRITEFQAALLECSS